MSEAKSTSGRLLAILDLWMKMQNCTVAFNYLTYRSDLDAVRTLECILRLLKLHLNSRRPEDVETINRHDTKATLENVVYRLDRLAKIAGIRFGCLTWDSNKQATRYTSQLQNAGNYHNGIMSWKSPHVIGREGAATTQGQLYSICCISTE